MLLISPTIIITLHIYIKYSGTLNFIFWNLRILGLLYRNLLSDERRQYAIFASLVLWLRHWRNKIMLQHTDPEMMLWMLRPSHKPSPMVDSVMDETVLVCIANPIVVPVIMSHGMPAILYVMVRHFVCQLVLLILKVILSQYCTRTINSIALTNKRVPPICTNGRPHSSSIWKWNGNQTLFTWKTVYLIGNTHCNLSFTSPRNPLAKP